MNLRQATQEIIKQVEEVTKKQVRIETNNALPVFAKVKIARKSMPHHLILYQEKYGEHINHIIAHECGHILRIFSVAEEQRKIPITNAETEQNAYKYIWGNESKLDRTPFNRNSFEIFYEGLIQQLTSLPQDIYIEKWMYNNYPELRNLQREMVQRQTDQSLQCLSDEIRKRTPDIFYTASNVMNYAFLRIIGNIIGVNFIKKYSVAMDIVNAGKKLSSITEASNTNNYQDDIELINQWAIFFNIRDWYTWTSFDSVPSDYYMS